MSFERHPVKISWFIKYISLPFAVITQVSKLYSRSLVNAFNVIYNVLKFHKYKFRVCFFIFHFSVPQFEGNINDQFCLENALNLGHKFFYNNFKKNI